MAPLVALGPLGGGVFLGWTLGANDAANVFGTAVAARMGRTGGGNVQSSRPRSSRQAP